LWPLREIAALESLARSLRLASALIFARCPSPFRIHLGGFIHAEMAIASPPFE